MNQDLLIDTFAQFALTAALGFLIGLEREMGGRKAESIGIREFVFLALLGAISTYLGDIFQSLFLVIMVFFGLVVLISAQYWLSYSKDSSLTTELAMILTFFIGVLVVKQQYAVAVALAIGTMGILFQKKAISQFKEKIKAHELQAGLKFLIITFIVLPLLPSQTLDTYLSYDVGKISQVTESGQHIRLELIEGYTPVLGENIIVVGPRGRPKGTVTLIESDSETMGAINKAENNTIEKGMSLRKPIAVPWLLSLASALNLYKIWLIVVLVSFVSFVGYVLIKIVGTSAGTGLTGLIGGLVSSTVTTLSFSRRSKETPELSGYFAGAVVLASSIMFPRLLLEIAIVDPVLMKSMAVPLLVMGICGGLLSIWEFTQTRTKKVMSAPELKLENPFSLKSAISFAVIFAFILMLTKVATVYLPPSWLPLISFFSGLTDADAIAFSLSSAHQSGAITADWASFNVVIGAIANTLMKLLIVYTIADRKLFLLVVKNFILIAAAGVITSFLYFDFG